MYQGTELCNRVWDTTVCWIFKLPLAPMLHVERKWRWHSGCFYQCGNDRRQKLNFQQAPFFLHLFKGVNMEECLVFFSSLLYRVWRALFTADIWRRLITFLEVSLRLLSPVWASCNQNLVSNHSSPWIHQGCCRLILPSLLICDCLADRRSSLSILIVFLRIGPARSILVTDFYSPPPPPPPPSLSLSLQTKSCK